MSAPIIKLSFMLFIKIIFYAEFMCFETSKKWIE